MPYEISEADLLSALTPEQKEQRQEITASLFENMPSENNCYQCKNDIRMLALAHLDFRYASFRFCCAVCLEEWLDDRQDQGAKKDK